MSSAVGCLSLFLILGTIVVHGYPHFKDKIPNGHNVWHPCKDNTMWYGVGHNNSLGGGVRNAFGKDFEKYGFEWNKCLCEADSDGDGLFNGEELGDPYCIWEKGDTPYRTTDITHPGICDTIKHDCTGQLDWLDCSPDEEKQCSGIEDPDVHRIGIHFPETPVPKEETTYICMGFNLTELFPADLANRELHFIGSKGDIDNSIVMHHTLVYACADENGEAMMNKFSSPTICGMATELCPTVISVWGSGFDWFCNNEIAGIPMGVNGYKYVVLQHHWNNPEKVDYYKDGSGVQLYVTPAKREHDSAVVFVGPAFIQLPPNFPSITIEGGCSSACTENMLSEPIYITHILPHMHYLGISFRFQIYRPSEREVIFEMAVERYNYETPGFEEYNPVVEVLPGDELRVDCVYQTKTKQEFTYYGEGTNEEMCFAIITYYPQLETVTNCDMNRHGYGSCYQGALDPNMTGACDFASFGADLAIYSPDMYANCDPAGKECFPDCKAYLDPLLNNTCFTGEAADVMLGYLGYAYGVTAVNPFRSCDSPPPVMPGDGIEAGTENGVCVKPPVAHASAVAVNLIGLMLMAALKVML